MFWAWLRNVLSMIEECSEPEWGRSEAGLGMIWVRTETGPGLVQDLSGTDRDYRDAKQSTINLAYKTFLLFTDIFLLKTSQNTTMLSNQPANSVQTTCWCMQHIRHPSAVPQKNACVSHVLKMTVSFDKQPSGRLRAVEYQVNVWKYCFRAQCVKFYNELLR